MDRAGWHSTDQLKVPENLTIILLPSRSPDLSPVENIWHTSDKTGSRTASSKITTPSLRPVAKPGTSSSISPKQSCPSDRENGLIKVDNSRRWYQALDPVKGRRSSGCTSSPSGGSPREAQAPYPSGQRRMQQKRKSTALRISTAGACGGRSGVVCAHARRSSRLYGNSEGAFRYRKDKASALLASPLTRASSGK